MQGYASHANAIAIFGILKQVRGKNERCMSDAKHKKMQRNAIKSRQRCPNLRNYEAEITPEMQIDANIVNKCARTSVCDGACSLVAPTGSTLTATVLRAPPRCNREPGNPRARTHPLVAPRKSTSDGPGPGFDSHAPRFSG